MSKSSSVSSVNSYSQALYELSKEDNCLESIEKEISNILKLLLEIEDFRNIIKDPTIKEKELSNTINAISEKFKFNLLLKKFLNFLVLKRRLFYLENILKDFLLICSQQRGEVSAKLISSKNLTESEINKIYTNLKEKLEGENVKDEKIQNVLSEFDKLILKPELSEFYNLDDWLN